MHVQYPAYLSERFPTEVRATAVGFCFHQGAIWGGLISPLLAYYATSHNIALSGPILVTTVVGLAVFLVAVLLSPETKGKVLAAPFAGYLTAVEKNTRDIRGGLLYFAGMAPSKEPAGTGGSAWRPSRA